MQDKTHRKMDRRTFFGAAAASGATVAAGLATPAIAQGKRELKMTLGFPKAFPGFGDFAVDIARRMEVATGGRLAIKVFGGGELVSSVEALDAASSGTVDMFYSSAYTHQHKSKTLNFFSTIPFGLSLTEHWAWYTHGGGQEVADEFFSTLNIKPFMCGQTYMQWGGWFNKQINSVEDVRGLKIRISGLGGEVYRKLGANPVVLPVEESQPAMASGVVDAIEQHTPWIDHMIGYHKMAKYYYYPGWQEPNTDMMLGFNKEVWESLSEEDREIISWVIPSGVVSNFGVHFNNSANQLALMKNEADISVLPFPDDVLQSFGKHTLDIMEELSAGDESFKKVWTSYREYLMKAMEYTSFTDQPFYNARTKVFAT